jgi:hypothetical protein
VPGAYLALAVNGLRALQAIGVDARRLGGFETPRMALNLCNGRQLVEFDYGHWISVRKTFAIARPPAPGLCS